VLDLPLKAPISWTILGEQRFFFIQLSITIIKRLDRLHTIRPECRQRIFEHLGRRILVNVRDRSWRDKHHKAAAAGCEEGTGGSLGLNTIKRAEAKDGKTSSTAANEQAIRRACEAAGVEFTNGDRPGVRLTLYRDNPSRSQNFLVAATTAEPIDSFKVLIFWTAVGSSASARTQGFGVFKAPCPGA
jgi:hypothetical protein